MAKALSVDNIMNISHDVYDFTGEWEAAFNKPESRGIWFIYGYSGSGKTSFLLDIAKYFTNFGTVAYNGLEEGKSKSFKDKLQQKNMMEVNGKFVLINDNLQELDARLSKRRSPDIIIIDSIDYFKMTWAQYLAFKKKHSSKTIIFVSHVKGKNPKSKIAIDVMYDAYIKIWVEGYRATSKGREIGSNGGIYTIWKEGADRYYGQTQNE